MNQKWKKKFFTIATGQAFSMIGSSAVQFALIWWLAEETSSPIMLGLSGLAAFLPMAFLSPSAGVMADRYNRKKICVTADLFQGIIALVYAIFLYLYQLPAWSGIAILLLRGAGSTFHQPAFQAMIPQIVPQEDLMKSNGWSQLIMSGSFMIGPVLGAVMYAALPLPIILLTDLLGAILASSLLAVVEVPKLERIEHEKTSFSTQFKEGVAVYREDKRLLYLVVAQTACMVFYLSLSSFYPLMSSDYFSVSAWHGSLVELSFALGMMLSAFLFGSVLHVKNKLATSYVGLIGLGVTSAFCGILPPFFWGWVLFTVICGLMGFHANVLSIPMVSYMQETIPQEKMGRAFSLLALSASFTMPVGLLIGGPVAEKLGVHTWFLYSGIGVLLITMIAVIYHRKEGKKQNIVFEK